MVNTKKIVAIIQARCNSVRLPDKVMKKIAGTPAIELLYKRLKKSKNQGNQKLTARWHRYPMGTSTSV